MANETWKFVLAKSKQAMKQVLGIKDDAARQSVTTAQICLAPSTDLPRRRRPRNTDAHTNNARPDDASRIAS